MPAFRTPNDTQHIVELGRTGSGKTQAGLFHLSLRNFTRKPWVIFDTKGDEMIEQIGRFDAVKYIGLGETPGKNGLHIVKMLPGQEPLAENFLYKIHQRENVGLFFDEGFMLGKSNGLDMLLTQGRSKHIPIIILSQRPAWLSRFVFSEASFFQIFQLTDERDRDTVQRFVPADRANLDARLPAFHSLWYDVGNDQVTQFSPVPPRDEILGTFKERLSVRKVLI